MECRKLTLPLCSLSLEVVDWGVVDLVVEDILAGSRLVLVKDDELFSWSHPSMRSGLVGRYRGLASVQ